MIRRRRGLSVRLLLPDEGERFPDDCVRKIEPGPTQILHERTGILDHSTLLGHQGYAEGSHDWNAEGSGTFARRS